MTNTNYHFSKALFYFAVYFVVFSYYWLGNFSKLVIITLVQGQKPVFDMHRKLNNGGVIVNRDGRFEAIYETTEQA